MRRAAAVPLLLLVLLPGCAAQDPAQPALAGDPAAVLAGIPAAARQAGTVTYSTVVESARDDDPMTVEGGMTGVLDVARDAGTADLQLIALSDLAADAEGQDDAAAQELGDLATTRLSWDATDLTVRIGDQEVTGRRDDADSGMFARIPEEPAGLFDVVAAADDVEVVGAEDVDGVATTHLRGRAEPRAAVDAGLGTQAHLAMARLPELPVEVWVDGEGRPVRIRYTAEVPSLQGSTRTIVTTYDYRRWGEPVDLPG